MFFVVSFVKLSFTFFYFEDLKKKIFTVTTPGPPICSFLLTKKDVLGFPITSTVCRSTQLVCDGNK